MNAPCFTRGVLTQAITRQGECLHHWSGIWKQRESEKKWPRPLWMDLLTMHWLTSWYPYNSL